MARAFEENTVTTPPSYPTEAANTGAMEMLLDLELPVPHAHTRFDEDGLTDEGIRTSLAEAVEVLAAEVRNREDLQVVA